MSLFIKGMFQGYFWWKAGKNNQHVRFAIWQRLAAAVEITQPLTINTLNVCQGEVGVDMWHNEAQDRTGHTRDRM